MWKVEFQDEDFFTNRAECIDDDKLYFSFICGVELRNRYRAVQDERRRDHGF